VVNLTLYVHISKYIITFKLHNQRTTASKYTRNYDFDYPQTHAQFTVTSVSGHLLEHDFGDAHRKWYSCQPIELFDAPVEAHVRKDNLAIKDNLEKEARRAQQLMIWTDCDREGENIGAEVMMVCRRVNPRIVVKRARFSAIIREQIHRAAQNPVELDQAQADAVEARTVLDLKIGAAFTRMQTLALQARFPQLQAEEGQKSSVVSYGEEHDFEELARTHMKA
jgi:DNA topoisomerase-3